MSLSRCPTHLALRVKCHQNASRFHRIFVMLVEIKYVQEWYIKSNKVKMILRMNLKTLLHLPSLLREQITRQNHMSLLWEQWPKALSVKEVILTCVSASLSKDIPAAVISPKKSCVPATYFERRFLKAWVLNLTLRGKLSFLCSQEKMFQCANQIQPRVRSTPVGDICKANARYRDDILVCGGRERASRKLQICQGKCSSELTVEEESVKKSLSKA